VEVAAEPTLIWQIKARGREEPEVAEQAEAYTQAPAEIRAQPTLAEVVVVVDRMILVAALVALVAAGL
jgi:hypothetical protein